MHILQYIKLGAFRLLAGPKSYLGGLRHAHLPGQLMYYNFSEFIQGLKTTFAISFHYYFIEVFNLDRSLFERVSH